MAAAYRSSTSTNTGAAAAGSVIVSLPAGVQVGDFLITCITADGGSGASLTGVPAGWTLLQNVTQGTNIRLWVYGRIATGYETSTYTWGFDISRSGSGLMAAYSGTVPFMPSAITSTNTSVASTTITGGGSNSTFTGRTVQIISARNTTAASTITPGGGYTKREETCTTASAFMNLELQETGGKTFPMGGVNSNGATCSQTATAIMVTIFMEDSHAAFATMDEDAYVVGSFTTARTSLISAPFQTNYPNELVLAFIGLNKDVTTVSSITGAGLTWTLVARANTNAGSSEIWRAFAPVPQNNQITVNFSASAVSGNLMIVGINGADIIGGDSATAIGAVNTGSTTAAAPSIAVTTTRNKSWVWAMANEGTAAAGTITVGANQTMPRSSNDSTNAAASWMWRQNSLTATSGTTVTMDTTVPTTNNCNVVAVEVVPAIMRNLNVLGVG